MKLPEKTEKLLMSFANAISGMFAPTDPETDYKKFEAILSTLKTAYQLCRIDLAQEKIDKFMRESGGQK